jgi:UDP-2,3-diacylglucosamine pyrophosphatase LpxH
MENSLTLLLERCEQDGTAPNFIVDPNSYKAKKTSFFKQTKMELTDPVKYKCDGEEIFVVSDLHIAGGRNKAGVFSGTENFFADESFARFLDHAQKVKKTDNAILIINGDIFDFLRVTDFPGKIRKPRIAKQFKHFLKFNPLNIDSNFYDSVTEEYKEWRDELAKIGINKSITELEASISKKERSYGLKTNDYKTIYKLIKIRKGHKPFFDALANWLNNGNKIIILKGNHDLEIYWLNVRNYLRLILGESIAEANEEDNLEEILSNKVLPNIQFVDDSILIDDDFYVEHGHRYDKFTMILDEPTLKEKPDELNIPFGSFFNRYLLNRIELFYPYLDNVRPTANVLPMLMRENFPLAIKVLLHHIPFMVKILFKNMRYLWFVFQKVVLFILAILLPLITAIIIVVNSFSADIGDQALLVEDKGFFSLVIDQFKSVGMLLLSYLLSRAVAWFQISEPSSLHKCAQNRLKGTDYRIMTMGHTHNPGEYIFEENKRFYNTGTWIPVVETSSADIRQDKTYTFLHLERDADGKLQPADNGLLSRWNDDAERFERQVLIKKK